MVSSGRQTPLGHMSVIVMTTPASGLRSQLRQSHASDSDNPKLAESFAWNLAGMSLESSKMIFLGLGYVIDVRIHSLPDFQWLLQPDTAH